MSSTYTFGEKHIPGRIPLAAPTIAQSLAVHAAGIAAARERLEALLERFAADDAVCEALMDAFEAGLVGQFNETLSDLVDASARAAEEAR